MWDSKKSIKLTLFVIRVLAVLFVILLFTAPFVFRWYQSFAACSEAQYRILVIVFYICSPSAALTLFEINRFLVSVRRGEVFTLKSVRSLRILSWTCFSAVPLSLPLCWFFFDAFPIPLAAGFMCLMLRVVKIVIHAAVQIKEENDLTV